MARLGIGILGFRSGVLRGFVVVGSLGLPHPISLPFDKLRTCFEERGRSRVGGVGAIASLMTAPFGGVRLARGWMVGWRMGGRDRALRGRVVV